jgi:ATP-dependent Clp protease ATP-binding subunit ClpC
MFDRFTDRARRVVVLAREDASRLGHGHIGPGHILLGLLDEGQGVAVRALEALDASPDDLRQQVEQVIGPSDHEEETTAQDEPGRTGHIPFTPGAKKVLEFSLRASIDLGHNYIGTEHILLGLFREGDGVAAQVLTAAGLDEARTRQEIIRLLAEHQASGAGAAAGIRPARGGVRLDELITRLESIETRLDVIQAKLDAIVAKLGITPDENGSASA